MKKPFLFFVIFVPMLICAFAVSGQGRKFRTLQSGDWRDILTWEMSTTPTSTSYQPADRFPTSVELLIEVNDSITLTGETIELDQVVVNNGGILVVTPGVTLTIVNGGGTDLNVTTGARLILQSDESQAARVAPFPAGVTLTQRNNVTVERFIPANGNRAYRLLTAPLRFGGLEGGRSVFETWQEGGANVAGQGVLITAPFTATTDNGLDARTGGYSLFGYDTATQKYVGIQNTKTAQLFSIGLDINQDALPPNNSYLVFIRGDRNPANLSTTNSNNTVLRATGNLIFEEVEFKATDIAAGNFLLVGNPYACSIDFKDIERINISNRFWAWDPRLGTYGAYILLEDLLDNGELTPIPNNTTSAQSQHIQSTQAFFVQAQEDPGAQIPGIVPIASVKFTEASKSNTPNILVFRNARPARKQISINLFSDESDNKSIITDGVVALFNDKYSALVNSEDASKMENMSENISLYRQNKKLTVERRPLMQGNDTLFLKLWNTQKKNYHLECTLGDFGEDGVSAFLEDVYLKSLTPLSTTNTVKVNFSITGDTASSPINRFRIILKSDKVLPVSFANIKAFQKSNAIELDWTMPNNSILEKFEIEKSTDGINWSKIGDLNAGINSQVFAYNFTDETPVTGSNYYRIKAFEKSGKFNYSTVVNVKLTNGKNEISIYPNPIQDKTLNLQFIGKVKGTYTITLFNSLGQVEMKSIIKHGGGSATELLPINSSVKSGIYQLQVASENEKTIMKLLIK